MSLKTFHIVFIGLSTLLLCGMTAWLLIAGMQTGSALRIAGGAASLACAAGLVVYGVRFLRRFRHLSFL